MAKVRSVVPVVLASKDEVHFFDTALSTDITTTVTVLAMNAMAGGSTAVTRSGRQIKMLSFQLKMRVMNEVSMAETKSWVRILLVYDKQPNKALPVSGDLLTSSTPEGMKNLNNRDRFRVLGDDVMSLDRVREETALAVNRYTWIYSRYWKLNSLPTTYSDASSGIGSVTSGSLVLVMFEAIAAGSADLNLVGESRLRFTA